MSFGSLETHFDQIWIETHSYIDVNARGNVIYNMATIFFSASMCSFHIPICITQHSPDVYLTQPGNHQRNRFICLTQSYRHNDSARFGSLDENKE